MIVACVLDYEGEGSIQELKQLKGRIDEYILVNEQGSSPEIKSSAVILAEPNISPCGYVQKPTLVIEIKLGTKNPEDLYLELSTLIGTESRIKYNLTYE